MSTLSLHDALPISRNDSFITENGSSRASVRRTRRGPRRSFSAGLAMPVVFLGLRLAPREADPLPVPIDVSAGEVSAADPSAGEADESDAGDSSKAGSLD